MSLQSIQLKIEFWMCQSFCFRFFRATSSGVAFIFILEKYRGGGCMKKVVLTQDQVDKLIVVGRVVVKPSLHGVGLNDVLFKISNGGK